MTPLALLPLVAAVTVVVIGACTPLSATLDRLVTRLAMTVFGGYARHRRSANREHAIALRAAHVSVPYAVYAARTLLYTAAAVAAGSVIGVYAVAAFLLALPLLLAAVPSVQPLSPLATLSAPALVAVLVVPAIAVGAAAGALTYQFRWSLPQYRASARGREIDDTIQRNVAFMFALSRSGMPFTEILRILARNDHVYGETATEFGVAVRDVDLFGSDLISALRRTGERTPSDTLAEFVENLMSVLQSGQRVSAFLRDQYDQYKQEAESEQERFLELLSTLAEAYVTVFVAGPLFLITILVVIGLVVGGTLPFLELFAYVIIPLATFGFVVYLDSITSDATFDADLDEDPGYEVDPTPDADDAAVTDGGVDASARANRERLRAYTRIEPYRYALAHPVETIVGQPVWLLAITGPLAVVYVAVRWFSVFAHTDVGVVLADRAAQNEFVAALDDPLAQAALFVLGTFALVWEIRSRRVDAIERTVPDFLDRLASTNEAGLPIVESIERVSKGDLGALDDELARTWADIQWGAHVERALGRFSDRVRTTTVTRLVTLTTNAMSATSDLGPVLRIAADEAKANERLKRNRRNELVTYLVVIYISFLVFLGIIVALTVIFVPVIPTAEQFAASSDVVQQTGGSGIAGVGQITAATKAAYSLTFFHTVLVQAVCSGLVAGQMTASDVRDGAKHAFLMLAVAYAIFLVFA